MKQNSLGYLFTPWYGAPEMETPSTTNPSPSSELPSSTTSVQRTSGSPSLQTPIVSNPRLSTLVYEGFVELAKDIIGPIRAAVATFIVFAVFFVFDQLFFYAIDWVSQDIKTRIPYVSWFLDGIQVCSLTGISVYFLFSGIKNLQTQWRYTRKVEKKAGLE